jgi:hypothetical protein
MGRAGRLINCTEHGRVPTPGTIRPRAPAEDPWSGAARPESCPCRGAQEFAQSTQER